MKGDGHSFVTARILSRSENVSFHHISVWGSSFLLLTRRLSAFSSFSSCRSSHRFSHIITPHNITLHITHLHRMTSKWHHSIYPIITTIIASYHITGIHCTTWHQDAWYQRRYMISYHRHPSGSTSGQNLQKGLRNVSPLARGLCLLSPPSHTTHLIHLTPLISHNIPHTRSSHTTHLTPLISNHSSLTTHLSPPSHTTHLIHLTSFISHHPSHTHLLLISHHSSHTTHLTPLISNHSSLTTHLSPPSHTTHLIHLTSFISHHPSHTLTTHLTPLISHYASHTTHPTPLISNHSSTPLNSHHSSYTTHPTPLISNHSSTPLNSHHSSYTTHISPLIPYHWKTQNFTCGVIWSFYSIIGNSHRIAVPSQKWLSCGSINTCHTWWKQVWDASDNMFCPMPVKKWQKTDLYAVWLPPHLSRICQAIAEASKTFGRTRELSYTFCWLVGGTCVFLSSSKHQNLTTVTHRGAAFRWPHFAPCSTSPGVNWNLVTWRIKYFQNGNTCDTNWQNNNTIHWFQRTWIMFHFFRNNI